MIVKGKNNENGTIFTILETNDEWKALTKIEELIDEDLMNEEYELYDYWIEK